jgi:hypothetical protein
MPRSIEFCEEGPRAPFRRWRDPYGGDTTEPRCCGTTAPRNPWSKHGGECTRKGVVFAGIVYGWERWYCMQHAPARKDEKRVAELAPTLRDLLREALQLMPRTKRSAEWRELAEIALERADGRRDH